VLKLPQYESRKVLGAVKIKQMIECPEANDQKAGFNNQDAAFYIIPEEKEIEKFTVSFQYMALHKPEIGGYYVQHADASVGFMDANSFERAFKPLLTLLDLPCVPASSIAQIREKLNEEY
jgi:hypothetical protein